MNSGGKPDCCCKNSSTKPINVASFEIRSGDLTREEGVSLSRQFDIEYPNTWLDDFLNYVSLPTKEYQIASKQFEQPVINKYYFDALVDKFRSPHIWRLDEQ